MQTVDWIVVGNGLAGAALSYELVKQGLSVLLVDDGGPDSATRYSYGGIAYWSATDPLTRPLFQAGMERQRQLSAELGAETEFRELDLLLTIAPGQDPAVLAQQYADCAVAPRLISAAEACELEPQLQRDAIAAALTVKHGHVHPVKLVEAYNQGFRRLGGQHLLAAVTGLVRIGDRVTGVTTPTQAYPAGQAVLVAAGAYSRRLLQTAGMQAPLYFTHAEILETPPLEIAVRTLIMPAEAQRFALEAAAADLWQTPARSPEAVLELAPGKRLPAPILDAGVIQFVDRSVRIGQISYLQPDFEPRLNPAVSEARLRDAIAPLLPALTSVPGAWRHCLVSFSQDGLPLLGPLPGVKGLHLFSGFTSPFAILPPLAERFVRWLGGAPDATIEQMQVARFEAARQA